jgi:hypothetical protein
MPPNENGGAKSAKSGAAGEGDRTRDPLPRRPPSHRNRRPERTHRPSLRTRVDADWG